MKFENGVAVTLIFAISVEAVSSWHPHIKHIPENHTVWFYTNVPVATITASLGSTAST
jgi:hypothetical protein